MLSLASYLPLFFCVIQFFSLLIKKNSYVISTTEKFKMFNQAYNTKCLILIIWSRGWVIINFTLAHVVSSLSASYLNTYQCFYFHFICVIYSFLHGFLLFSSIKTSFPVCCRHSKISGSKRKKTSQSI